MATTEASWTVEGPDHSVGIFGTLVIHDCGTELEAEETGTSSRVEGRVETITTHYRCPACGSTHGLDESQPADWPEDDEGWAAGETSQGEDHG